MIEKLALRPVLEKRHCVVGFSYRNIAGMFPQEEPNKGMMFSPNSDEPEDEEIKPTPPKPVFSRVK